MPAAIIGKKIGMTRLYTEDGTNVPVTIIEAGPCFVSQVKTEEVDGYNAVQIAFEDVKARNSTMPMIGHDGKAGLAPKRQHREIRLTADEVAEVKAGQEVNVEAFEGTLFVDVTGTSKGKGHAGFMKKWGFKGQLASHGVERKHRSPGSISGRSGYLGGGRPKKGRKMAGQMGAKRITTRSLEIVDRDKEKNLLVVKGAVPGPNNGIVFIKEAKRLYKSKAAKAKAQAS